MPQNHSFAGVGGEEEGKAFWITCVCGFGFSDSGKENPDLLMSRQAKGGRERKCMCLREYEDGESKGRGKSWAICNGEDGIQKSMSSDA